MSKEQEVEIIEETPTTLMNDADTTTEKKTPYKWQLSSLQQQPA